MYKLFIVNVRSIFVSLVSIFVFFDVFCYKWFVFEKLYGIDLKYVNKNFDDIKNSMKKSNFDLFIY